MDEFRDRFVRKGNYIYGSFLKPQAVDGLINRVNAGDRSDLVGRFPFTEESVDDAVQCARKGFRVWRRVGLNDRAAAVHRFREALAAWQQPLASLMARETGVPAWEARREVLRVVRDLDVLLDDGLQHVAPTVIDPQAARSDRRARGVVAVLAPSITPLYVMAVHVAMAVLAGNSAVFKPSKFTPATGQLTAELWDRCRLPRGLVNMVQGSGSGVGARLVAHPGVDIALFTGSWKGAQAVRRALVDRPDLPVVFQTGGKSTAIVLADADLPRAAFEILVGAFLASGQRPDSTARVIVEERVWGAFAGELVRRAAHLRVGYSHDHDAFVGPLVSDALRTQYRRLLSALQASGAHALLPGDAAHEMSRRGHYVLPVIAEVPWATGPAHLADEPPGPALLLYRVADSEQALALHERFHARRACAVFSRQAPSRLQPFTEQLTTGAVLVNRSTLGLPIKVRSAPMGSAGDGHGQGLDLLSHLAVPRGWMADLRAFDPSRELPGMYWQTNGPPVELRAADIEELTEDTETDKNARS